MAKNKFFQIKCKQNASPAQRASGFHDHATREFRNEDENVTGVLVYPIRLMASVISSGCVKSTRNGITKEIATRFVSNCNAQKLEMSKKKIKKLCRLDGIREMSAGCTRHPCASRNEMLDNYTVGDRPVDLGCRINGYQIGDQRQHAF